jgi:hypothetical protein
VCVMYFSTHTARWFVADRMGLSHVMQRNMYTMTPSGSAHA